MYIDEWKEFTVFKYDIMLAAYRLASICFNFAITNKSK